STISAYAGSGTLGTTGDGGAAASALLAFDYGGIDVDANGALYFADGGNDSIRRIDPSGAITTVAGTGASGFGGDNGLAHRARPAWPGGVATGRGGVIYISDTNNHRVRKVDAGLITTIAGPGSPTFGGDNNPAVNAQLSHPTGLAVDAQGNLYVTD